MAAAEQNYGNHLRFFPLFHFFAFPILLIHFVVTVVWLVRAPSLGAVWTAVVAAALAGGLLAARVMTVTVQDRLIRLEERLRLAQVLPPELRPRIEQLTLRQMIGLRFASDAEVPDLFQKIIDGALKTEKEIKQAVTNWRADHVRA